MPHWIERKEGDPYPELPDGKFGVMLFQWFEEDFDTKERRLVLALRPMYPRRPPDYVLAKCTHYLILPDLPRLTESDK